MAKFIKEKKHWKTVQCTVAFVTGLAKF